MTSPRLLNKLGDVLRREKFRRYTTEADVELYVEFLRHESIFVDDPEPAPQALSEDPDDEYLVALARAARVEALVSGDRHLTNLRDKIPALTPREFLASLQAH